MLDLVRLGYVINVVPLTKKGVGVNPEGKTRMPVNKVGVEVIRNNHGDI
jgi:hypothetical protein